MKPRIIKYRGWWVCGSWPSVRGFGSTPIIAYNDWVRQKNKGEL